MSIKAMKKALEALIASTAELRMRLASPTDLQLLKNEQAIIGLRQAIEQAEKDSIDAKCFRFWVREAANSPLSMAHLIMHCRTEQDYRDAIIPVIQQAEAAIYKAEVTK